MFTFSPSSLIPIGIIVLICLITPVVADEGQNSSAMYQASSFAMVESGNFSPVITVDDMNRYGNFGVGAFEDMDGELTQIDGTIYQIRNNGKVTKPSGNTGICFGNTVLFHPDYSFELHDLVSKGDLLSTINGSFPDHNLIYAYKVEGIFSNITFRSIPAQEEPYPTLAEVLKNQSKFQLTNVSGTISGFWFPEWMQGVNYAGFHPHFITTAHDAGGHVLEVIPGNVTVSVQPVYNFTMLLPKT
jgi:acetolactate decarboxylase